MELVKFPLFSYPTVIDCLGIKPQSPKVEFKEGFIRASFNLEVSEANESCLFLDNKVT